MEQKDRKIVVFDFNIPELQNNKMFDPVEAVKVSHTILPTCFLYRQGLKRGFEMMTVDVFLNLKQKPKEALLVTHLITPYTSQAINAGAKPILLMCMESPFIATRFYMDLKNISGKFAHSMVFSGMKKRLSSKTEYHQVYFPNIFGPGSFKPIPFSQKKYLTMISSNKRMGNVIKGMMKNLLLKIFYGFGVTEIYHFRHEIINFFADSGIFDLFGFGWESGGTNFSETENIKKVYQGVAANKLSTLSRYKFAFCPENALFSGYITDRIFDCMMAGVVPIYLGAPDILSYIPVGAFIDMRDFKNLAELKTFLMNMDESTYNVYLQKIQQFLLSSKFYSFTQEFYAEKVLGILDQEFKKLNA